MRLAERRHRGRRRLDGAAAPGSPTPSSSSARVVTRRASAAARGSSGSSSGRSGPEHRGAGRLQHHDRLVARQPGAASVRRSTRRAVSSWPVVIQVSAAADRLRGTTTSKPAAASTRTAACATSGARWLLKVSGHSTTRPRSRGRPHRRPSIVTPARERPRGEGRDGPLGGDPGDERESRRVRRDASRAFASGRHPPGQPQPERQPAQRVVRARPEPPPVVVVQELRLVGGHVDPGRAVRDAAPAGQAEVQRVAHLGRAPALAAKGRRPPSPGAGARGRAWSAARRRWRGSWGTSAPTPGGRRSGRPRCSGSTAARRSPPSASYARAGSDVERVGRGRAQVAR